MKKTKEDILSMKPSEIVTFGVEAVLRLERKEGWRLDNSVFHGSEEGNICLACIGGAAAVLAYYGNFETKVFNEGVFQNEDGYQNLEDFLNCARAGVLDMAFDNIGLDARDGEGFNRDMRTYEKNRKGFIEDLEALALDLQTAGF